MKNLSIIFEDEWLLVVEKPSGMLTMSTGKDGEVTAYSILYDYLARKGEQVFIVHRLDRDTSGVMMFAKDFQVKEYMQREWNETILERKYMAVLEGRIDSEEGWIETWLRENPVSKKVQCRGYDPADDVEMMERGGWKWAESHCKTLSYGKVGRDLFTCVEFSLETGRKNQIRVQSQWIGHPVAGDRKYGASTNPFGRLALHARTISFRHPVTGKTLSFTSRLPKEFKALQPLSKD